MFFFLHTYKRKRTHTNAIAHTQGKDKICNKEDSKNQYVHCTMNNKMRKMCLFAECTLHISNPLLISNTLFRFSALLKLIITFINRIFLYWMKTFLVWMHGRHHCSHFCFVLFENLTLSFGSLGLVCAILKLILFRWERARAIIGASNPFYINLWWMHQATANEPASEKEISVVYLLQVLYYRVRHQKMAEWAGKRHRQADRMHNGFWLQ